MTDKHFSRLARSFLPATAVLELTYRCSNACIFCSCPWEAPDAAFELKYESTPEEWKSCIAMLLHMGVTSLAFTGGEPLLKPHVLELLEYAACRTAVHTETENGRLVTRKGPPELYLLTNGQALSDEILALCARLGVTVSISLPGLTTYKEHTRREDADTVLHWFEVARDMGVETVVGVTVTRLNLFELYEIISAALLAGAGTLLMNRFLPGGRGLLYADRLALSPEQVVQMLDTAETVLARAGRFGSVGTELPRCLIDPSRYEHLRVGTRCSAVTDFFVVGPSGYVRVCNHSPVRLDHFTEIRRLRTNEYWMQYVLKDFLPRPCYTCPQIGGCDGGCREAARIVGGRINAADPLMPHEG